MLGRSLGRYRILEEVGAGGMGVVYRAHDERLDRDVALKVLAEGRVGDQASRKRLREEARSLSKLNHPNIATIHDFDIFEGVDCLVMEFIPGTTLEDMLASGPMEEEEAVRLAIQLAEGLGAAHEQGVIHRDLKPGNLRVTPDGRLKILDFGLALLLRPTSDSATTASGWTDAQAAVGTLPYMAPEQLRGESADERTDIYAAGAALYQMATGERPFPESRGAELMAAIFHRAPRSPSELNPRISPALGRIVLKSLGKDRARRHQSARELLADLDAFRSTGTSSGSDEAAFPFLEREEGLVSAGAVFVARENELSSLEGHLQMALGGGGRIAFVTGEAGQGKTSLLSELGKRSMESHPELVVASGNCNAHTGMGEPYLPFREALGQLTGDIEARWRAGAVSKDHAVRLWHCLPLTVGALVERGPELIDLLLAGSGIVSRARTYAPGGSEWLTPLEKLVARKASLPRAVVQQTVLFEQYARVLESLAKRAPLLLALDDLQWADTGSIGLLLHLIERVPGSRILIVGAYRPEEVAQGRGGERHPLRPVVNACRSKFGEVEVSVGASREREFIDAVVDIEPNRLSSEFREALCRQTGRHSLFTVELLRAMKDQGALVQDGEGRWIESEGLDWGTLPARVEAMIGERIERLPEGSREVLRLASVEGEVFTAEALAKVHSSEERGMVRLLSDELDKRHHLVAAQDMQRMNGQRLSFYKFRHILFQRYLYSRLDKVERSYLHEELARALETLYSERAVSIAGKLARHFQEAGLRTKALEYLQLAAAEAIRQSAHGEGITLYTRALSILEELPASGERVGQELAIQLPLGLAIMSTRGYADAKVGKVFTRAQDLCKQIGETPQILMALFGLWAFHFTRADFELAPELAEQILRLAPGAEDRDLALQIGHNAQAANLTMLGECEPALVHAEKVSAHYDPEKHRNSAFLLSQDLKPTSMSWATLDLWMLGYPDRARQKIEDTLRFARELGHPYTLSFVLQYAVMFNHLRRDVGGLHKAKAELLELAMEYGFRQWFPIMLRFEGWLLLEGEKLDEGVETVRKGIATARSFGTGIFFSLAYSILADGYRRAGRAEEGLEAVNEGLSFVKESGERYQEAELHRICAELYSLRGSDESEVEGELLTAIDIAREQKAKSLELRATMSLARRWKAQGKSEEAHQTMKAVYSWFTEGFETRDLQEARALLDELSTASDGSFDGVPFY